jgi:kynurenine formamidase
LSSEDIDGWEKANGPIPEGSIVLINAGWGKHWDDPDAYLNRDASGRMTFPGVSILAAEMLAENSAVVGIGVDTLSPDNGLVEGSPCHKIIHGAGKIILENVANLDHLPSRDFTLFVGVLPIEDGTAAPCRLIALVPAGRER